MRNTRTIGLAFIAIGIALTVTFRTGTVGTGSGIIFIVLGIVFLVRSFIGKKR